MSATFQKSMVGHSPRGNVYNYKIFASKGTKGICANDGMASYSEAEYLLGHDTKIHILEVNPSKQEVICVIVE